MKKFGLLSALLFAIAFLMTSCEKDPGLNPGEETAPPLPPEESFIMPFTGFEDADTTRLKGKDTGEEKSGPTTYTNWFVAATNVVVWNTVVGLTTGVPVASFKEAFNHEPVYTGNGIFVWSYDFQVDGKIYVAALSGQFIDNNQNIKWEMKISQLGGFNSITWYTGIVSENLRKANWTLYHNPLNPEPFIAMDYELDAAGKVFSLRYTNIIPGNADNGAYIEYRVQAGQEYNRGYDVYQIKDDNLLEIEWNTPGANGHIRNAAFYQDNDWHCWNSLLMDVDCN